MGNETRVSLHKTFILTSLRKSQAKGALWYSKHRTRFQSYKSRIHPEPQTDLQNQ